MNSISVTKVMEAPQQAVWDVLADFANIADWNSGVATSFHSGGPEEVVVGTQRHCDLKPMGALDETLQVIEEPSRAVVSIDKAARIPIKHGEVEFLLAAEGDGTRTTINYTFQPKGGPIAGVIGKMLEGQLTKGFTGFLDELETAAQAQPA
ncbi:MAG: SRPBCC family protein [Actinomycetota bacterium]